MSVAEVLDRDVPTIESWYPVLKWLAFRAARQTGCEFDDMLSIGHVAILKAQSEFRPGLGLKFNTYATMVVRRAMASEALRIRGKAWRRGDVARAMERLMHEEHREVSPADVAERAPELGATVRRMQRHDRVTSLDAPLSAVDSRPREIAGAVIDFGDLVYRHDVCEAVNALSDRQRFVVKAYFFEDRTLQEIGHEIGRTKELVRRILVEAIQVLRVVVDGGVGEIDPMAPVPLVRKARNAKRRMRAHG